MWMEDWEQGVHPEQAASGHAAAAVQADLACKSCWAVTNASLQRLLLLQAGQEPNTKGTGDSWLCGKLAGSAPALPWEPFTAIFICPARCPPQPATLMWGGQLGHLCCCHCW